LKEVFGGRLGKLKKPWLLCANSINYSYVDGGIFGVVAQAKGGSAGELVTALLSELKNLENTTEDELALAKSGAKARLQSSRVCRINAGTYTALRLFGGGKVLSVTEESAQIDHVSLAQLKSIVKKFSNPSLVSHGDVRGTPKL